MKSHEGDVNQHHFIRHWKYEHERGYMTINDIIKRHEGVASVEIYESIGVGSHFPINFHTDNCRILEDYDPDKDYSPVIFRVVDEEEYNSSINANSCITDDFEALYDNKEAKVLLIMVPPQISTKYRRAR